MTTLKIVKIGGNIIDDDKALSDFLKQFSKLDDPKLLVHGGGKLATKLATKLQIPVQMHEGRRITDSPTLDVITMVYAGKINKTIVAQLQANNCNAVGLSGADGNTIVSVKRPIVPTDYGFVGDVSQINASVIELLLAHAIIPVFCAITHNQKGQLLNTNADTVASELAIALSKRFQTELYYCFEKNGVLSDVTDDKSVIQHIHSETYKSLIDSGIITDGMLPKLNNCFNAIYNNVHKVCIGKPDMLFKANTIFTTITK
jgi:acetylglutamate kinase